MVAEFEPAVENVLDHEGRYLENDPDDPGGITHYGITLPVLIEMGEAGDMDHDGDVDPDDIRALSEGEAKRVYRQQWWDRFSYGNLPTQLVGTKMLDTSVNLGWPQAHRILQRALGDIGFDVEVDGILGHYTWAAIHDACYQGDGPLVAAIRNQQRLTYGRILAHNPKLEKYRKGWMRRAAS